MWRGFLAWIFDDYVHGDIICDIYLEPNTKHESNRSSIQPQIQRHTLSFKHQSNLEQKSACADCLEVGIQILNSFSEVTTPILCITDSLLNSYPGVAVWGGWWYINDLFLIRISEKRGRSEKLRKQNTSSLKISSSYLLWVRGWLLARSTKVHIPFKTLSYFKISAMNISLYKSQFVT